MNTKTLLLHLNRAARPVVDALGLNRLARPVWRALWGADRAEFVHAEQNGRKWWLDPDVALRGREQEMDTIEWLRSVVRPGDRVIDVGANVGQMTLEMAQLTGPGGRVIAIEPGPGNLRLLQKHVQRNGFTERVSVLAAACCATHGAVMQLSIPGSDQEVVGSGFQLADIGARTNPLTAGAPATRVAVPTVSLDGLLREQGGPFAVLKIDVEGAELEVLRGAAALLRESRPQVRFGFHPFAFEQVDQAQREIELIFAQAGYQLSAPTGRRWGLEEITGSPVR